MSDGSLSQDEIDALLQGAGGMDLDEPSPAGAEGISDAQLGEFSSTVQETIDTQGSNFAMLLSKSVTLGAPQVDQVNGDMITTQLQDEVIHIKMDYTEGASGEHGYFINPDVALAIAGPMMGLEGVELDDASINALQEAFSNLNGPVSSALGDKIGGTLMSEPPAGSKVNKNEHGISGKFIRLTYPLTIDGQAIGNITEYYSSPLVASVIGMGQAQAAPAMSSGADDLNALMGGGDAMAMGGADLNPFGGAAQPAAGMGGEAQQMQSVQFPNLSPGPGTGISAEQGNIGLLMDVFMEMTVELGRTKKLIKEILGMGEGTIIELDKLAGEPVDILVNHKLIAKGEVVVIDENFGVRVTEIVSPLERMTNMT